MKLVRVGERGAERPAVLDDAGAALDVPDVVPDFGPGFFAGGGLARVAEAVAGKGLQAVSGRIGAPIARPGKVACIGLNYSDHAAETGQAEPPRPVVFMKDPATVVGPYDDVLIPRGSARTDWEVELGVVIGSTARYLGSPADGLAAVAGYAISHDVSESGTSASTRSLSPAAWSTPARPPGWLSACPAIRTCVTATWSSSKSTGSAGRAAVRRPALSGGTLTGHAR